MLSLASTNRSSTWTDHLVHLDLFLLFERELCWILKYRKYDILQSVSICALNALGMII